MSKLKNAIIKTIGYTIGQVSVSQYTKFLYRITLGKKLDLENPKDINEKIQWLKLYSDTSTWSVLADKYRMREYVEQCGFADMLVPLIGVWKDASEIEWEKLPKSYVMKVNNGSGDILICKNNLDLNWKYWTKRFNKLLNKNFGIITAEPHYRKITPYVIAEKLLDIESQPIKTSSLIDYKIWCFDGNVRYIWICYNRIKGQVQTALYDLDWNRLKKYERNDNHYRSASIDMPKPLMLNEMIRVASVLSKGYPQMRVDLYEIGGKVYIGELTLTSACGMMPFYTNDFLRMLGEECNIKMLHKN